MAYGLSYAPLIPGAERSIHSRYVGKWCQLNMYFRSDMADPLCMVRFRKDCVLIFVVCT